MIKLYKPDIDMAQRIKQIAHQSGINSCDITFGNIFCWAGAVNGKVAFVDDGFVVSYADKKFSYPVGCKNPRQVIMDLFNQNELDGVFCYNEKDANEMAGLFENITISEYKAGYEYVYKSEKLQNLKGKKLASKRNHINAFLSDGTWHCEKITDENIEKVKKFNEKWYLLNDRDKGKMFITERKSVKLGLDNFSLLGFDGLILYKNDDIVAFSYGEKINDNIYCVHVEKALSDIRGAYPMINKQFALTYCKDYEYINREDAAGDEGLIKAKNSYQPDMMIEKYYVKLR